MFSTWLSADVIRVNVRDLVHMYITYIMNNSCKHHTETYNFACLPVLSFMHAYFQVCNYLFRNLFNKSRAMLNAIVDLMYSVFACLINQFMIAI